MIVGSLWGEARSAVYNVTINSHGFLVLGIVWVSFKVPWEEIFKSNVWQILFFHFSLIWPVDYPSFYVITRFSNSNSLNIILLIINELLRILVGERIIRRYLRFCVWWKFRRLKLFIYNFPQHRHVDWGLREMSVLQRPFANVPLNFSLINRNASFAAHIIYNVERHNSRSVHKKNFTHRRRGKEMVKRTLKLTTTGCDSHSYYSLKRKKKN